MRTLPMSGAERGAREAPHAAHDTPQTRSVIRAYRARRGGEPSTDLILFTALLRELGVPVPVGSELLALRAMSSIALERRADVHTALRSCLTASDAEALTFELAFAAFWSADPDEPESRAVERHAAPVAPGAGGGSGALPTGSRAHADRASALTGRARYSDAGSYRRQVVAFEDRRRELDALARRLTRALARSRSRRLEPRADGELIDVRESLRRNLRFGDELFELRRMRQASKRPRLVTLCDVSSSMEPYTPLFLAFVHALTRTARTVESAIFNVELAVVTDVFHRRALADSLGWLAARSVALAGGTKIGHCLFAFNNEIEAGGLAARQTTALVLSDGWDVGEPDLLESQMRRLRANVGRILWLDPHAADAEYRPQVRGLLLALPFLDDYLGFSDLASLARLVSRVEQAG